MTQPHRIAWLYHGGSGALAFSAWLVGGDGSLIGEEVRGTSPQDAAAKVATREGFDVDSARLVDSRRLSAVLRGEALGRKVDADDPFEV